LLRLSIGCSHSKGFKTLPNENNVITNPEFGADQSNPDYAKNYQNYPPSATLPATVIIYSSGPDRDPKTWHDNICSWRN
jgi:hypothetical protein